MSGYKNYEIQVDRSSLNIEDNITIIPELTPWNKSSTSSSSYSSSSRKDSVPKYEPSYGRTRSNSINKNDEDKSATSLIAAKYAGGYSTNYQRDTGATRDSGRSENSKFKPLLDKKDTLHPPVSYRPISRTGARSRDPSPIDKSEKSSSSSSYNLSRLYPTRPYTKSVSRERTDSSNSSTTIPKLTGRAVPKDEVSKYSSRAKDEIPKYMGRTSIGKDEPVSRYKTASRATSREDLSIPQKYTNSRYKAAGRTTSREDLSNPQRYINSRFLPKNAIEKSHTAYARPINRTHEVSQRNKELLSVLQAQQEHERHSRPSSRCSSVTPDDHYQREFTKIQTYEPATKNVEMETVSVVTRGTSPTPTTSTQSSFLRSRRTEVAKLVEKTITRPKIRPVMVDQEMQSDRLDDSTKSSRFAGASRISATPWSSFLDMKFSSPTTKQKTKNESSQNNSDKSCDSPKSISRASSSKSISQGSSKYEGKNKEKKSPSPSFKSKLIPPKQVQTTDKKQLPPQIPNTNKSNSIHSQNIQNKDFRKSVLNMNPDKKKNLGRRSNSASSADSDHSMADAEATDVSENLATCKSYHPSMASRLPQKMNDPRSRRSPSSDASSSSTSEDDVKNKFKGQLSAGSSRTSMILSSADELSQDKLPKIEKLKIKDKPETVEAKSFLMRALAPVTNLFKVRQAELPEKAVISEYYPDKEESPEKAKPRLATLILTKVETSDKPSWYNETPSQSSHELSSHSNSISKSPKQLTRIDNNTGKPFMRHVDSGDIPWWLDEKAEVPEGVETYPNWVREDGTTEDGKKIFKIRHNESDESNWWLDSSEKSKSDPNPANFTYVHEDGLTEDGRVIYKVRHNDSEESSWWVDSGDKSNSELKRLNTIDQEYLEQNNIRPIEDGVTEDGRIIYKIRHNDSDETSWWVDSSEKSNNSSHKNQQQEKYKLRHIDSGERAWWLSSSENVSEMVQPQEEQENKSKYAIRHQDFDDKPWWLNNRNDNEKNQSDNESGSEIPLGDRASPEGLEMPKDEGRLSPYDNVPQQDPRDKKRINMNLFISKHTNIDDILGGSGQLWSPVSDKMFSYNDPSQECTEIDARHVIIHEPSPRRGDIHSQRLDNMAGVSNAYSFRKLDDAALQLYKDGDYGSYLDLEASISEQQEEFEGFQSKCRNSIKMGTETLVIKNLSKREIDYGGYESESADLLSQWLNSLETRSSLFWLHYIDGDLPSEEDHDDDDEKKEQRANSLESTSTTASDDIDGDNDNDYATDKDFFAIAPCRSIAHRESDLLVALSENCTLGPVCYFCSKKNSIVLRTQLSVRVHTIIEKLLTSEGRELRRALFSLKQIFQEDKDLVHEFVQNDGLSCLIKVGSEADQNYQNYILRALGQVMLYVDGMNGVMDHNPTIQWLYSLISSKFRLVVKTALKLLLVFVEYTESNCMLLIKAIHAVDYSQGLLPYHNIMKLLKDFDSADTELLIYATTLINKLLNGVPDQDTYYDQADILEEQGIEAIIQRYMSKPGTDLDLLQQFQIYEAVLQYEDGEEMGLPNRHLDENLRKTLRSRKSVGHTTERRKSRRHSTGNTPMYGGLNNRLNSNLNNSINNNLIIKDDDESSSSQSSEINSQLNGSYKDSNKAVDAGVTPALKRRRERAERQRSFMREQQESVALLRNNLKKEDENNKNNENGNFTNALQQRIANGNVLNGNYIRKDLTPLLNAVNKMDSEESLTKQPWIMSMIQNQENLTHHPDSIITNENDRDMILELRRENTVKDLTQKLANQNILHSPSEDSKVNRMGDMTGLISKAKEGLAKSKSKADVLKSPTSETMPKLEIKKSENELRWEELLANLNRPLNLCDMDFTDLASDDENDVLVPAAVLNGIPPPPPPLRNLGPAPPPPPLGSKIPPPIPPPAFGVTLQRPNKPSDTKIPIKKNKKTVKLFWKEVRDDPVSAIKLKSGFIWDELNPVNVDTQKLEHLFESRAKDLISKKQQEMNKNKEIIVLDPKRSNAINIGMTKLPPPRSIKTAILKMDATIMNREGIEKLLTMLPTEEERTKIQEAQAANPDLPLGSAEQFLLTLASISELPARLKLWAFKLDFENSEREIAEPLMDLKQGFEVLKVNKTFRGILSTLLSIGNFLNGNEVKGFQIEYLAKVPEVKDTVHKHSLLHHLCHIVMDKFPDATDLYSEIGAITRASKVDFDELTLNIQRLEADCKASWDHLKLIAKHDGSTMMKVKMSDFLADCAERIILLSIIHRRIINRFHKFLLWLGVPLHQISDTKPNEFCRIISEFALEYRTTRERVLQQLEKKANHRERNKTRGKMITDTGKFRTKEDRADAELRQLLGSDMSEVESMQGTLPWRRTRRDDNRLFMSPGNGNMTDGDDELLETLVKTATKGSSRTAPRERKRTRHADRKSLRRTLKNGLSEEEKKHLSAYIKGY